MLPIHMFGLKNNKKEMSIQGTQKNLSQWDGFFKHAKHMF